MAVVYERLAPLRTAKGYANALVPLGRVYGGQVEALRDTHLVQQLAPSSAARLWKMKP